MKSPRPQVTSYAHKHTDSMKRSLLIHLQLLYTGADCKLKEASNFGRIPRLALKVQLSQTVYQNWVAYTQYFVVVVVVVVR